MLNEVVQLDFASKMADVSTDVMGEEIQYFLNGGSKSSDVEVGIQE